MYTFLIIEIFLFCSFAVQEEIPLRTDINSCYLLTSNAIYDRNKMIITLNLKKDEANRQNCSKIPRGVNFTMYLDRGIDASNPTIAVGELRTRLRNYSWDTTTSVTFSFPTNITLIQMPLSFYLAVVQVFDYKYTSQLMVNQFSEQKSALANCFDLFKIYIGLAEVIITQHSTQSCNTQFQGKDTSPNSYLSKAELTLGSFLIPMVIGDFITAYQESDEQNVTIPYLQAAELRLASPIQGIVTFSGVQQSSEVEFTITTADISYYSIEGFFTRTDIYASLEKEFVVITAFGEQQVQQVLQNAGAYKVIQFRLIVTRGDEKVMLFQVQSAFDKTVESFHFPCNGDKFCENVSQANEGASYIFEILFMDGNEIKELQKAFVNLVVDCYYNGHLLLRRSELCFRGVYQSTKKQCLQSFPVAATVPINFNIRFNAEYTVRMNGLVKAVSPTSDEICVTDQEMKEFGIYNVSFIRANRDKLRDTIVIVNANDQDKKVFGLANIVTLDDYQVLDLTVVIMGSLACVALFAYVIYYVVQLKKQLKARKNEDRKRRN